MVCDPYDLGPQNQVVSFHLGKHEVWTIHPSAMPVGSRIVISYQQLPMGGLICGVGLELAGHPPHCAEAPDPHWTPQPGWTAPTDDPAHDSRTANGPAKTR